MRRLGYDRDRMTRQPPAMRFQAEQSNALWHFDMSPSDLKQLATPPWIDPDRSGAPTLMLFSVVDDRSGVAYQEAAFTARTSRQRAAFCLLRCRARQTRQIHSRGFRPFSISITDRSQNRRCSSV
jgi:hypothetical protein